MNNIEQLELFPLSEHEKMHIEIRELRNSLDKLRKSMFSRHADLSNNIIEVVKEVQDIKGKLTNEQS